MPKIANSADANAIAAGPPAGRLGACVRHCGMIDFISGEYLRA
jgi:hypothetical protein